MKTGGVYFPPSSMHGHHLHRNTSLQQHQFHQHHQQQMANLVQMDNQRSQRMTQLPQHQQQGSLGTPSMVNAIVIQPASSSGPYTPMGPQSGMVDVEILCGWNIYFHHSLWPFIYFTHFSHQNIHLKKKSSPPLYSNVSPLMGCCAVTGFQATPEIRENLENEFPIFHSGKTQGIWEKHQKSGEKTQGIWREFRKIREKTAWIPPFAM